jgi:hypothetical protein
VPLAASDDAMMIEHEMFVLTELLKFGMPRQRLFRG